MTISNQTARTGPYNGNGSTTVFAYDFRALDQTHLVVTLKDAANVETVQTLTTNYTVSGVGDASGGNITMGVAPASGEQLTISRAVPQTQVVDLANRGAVAPEVLEGAYDKLTQLSQDKVELLNRMPRFPVSSSLTGVELPLTLTANTALIVNAAGTGYTNGPTASQISGAEASASAAASSATDSENSATASAASAATASQYAGTQTVDLFNGTGSQTAFTLSVAPANGDENNTDVHISGVYQQKNTYAVSGTTLTFSTAPPSGTGNVEVMHMSPRAIETPADGSVTYPKFASGLVDIDLTAVSAADDTIASAKAIKTYVDAQVGTADTLSEVLALGNTSGGTNLIMTAGDALTADTISETTAAAGVTVDGVLLKDGEVDGRDVSVDGTKLDTVETNADVTDTANVTAAGALMDSELTNITAVKALNQGVATTDSPSFAGLTATTADINGGTIDGAVIGGSSAAAGTFTTLVANSTLGVGTSSISSSTSAEVYGNVAGHVGLRVNNASASGYSTLWLSSGSSNEGMILGGASAAAFADELALLTASATRSIALYPNNAKVAEFDPNGLSMANAAGPALLNEAATGTNPTVLHDRSAPTYGLGGTSTTTTLVANGIAGITLDSSAAASFAGDITVENGVPVLLLRTTSATGRSDIQFGDPASVGVGRLSYNHNGDYLSFYIVGAETFRMNSSQLLALNAAGPALLNEAATSTNPTLVANRADPDTGLGWVSANIGALVAGGTNVFEFSSSGPRATVRGELNIQSASGNDDLKFNTITSMSRSQSSGKLTISTNADNIEFTPAGGVVALSNAAGPALLNEAASSSNPTLVANRGDPTTGIASNTGGNLWLISSGGAVVALSPGGLGFYGASPTGKQTVTGSRGGNAALADLLTKLATLGLITDSTS